MTTRTIPTRNGHTIPMSVHYPLWISGGTVELKPVADRYPPLHVLAITSAGGEVDFHATEDQLRSLQEAIAEYLASLNFGQQHCELVAAR